MGQWPAEACTPEFIRENLHFDQLIVSLSGTSIASGCKVYGLHVYEYEHLHIGYRFSSILDYGQDGRLLVDLKRVDEIREQRGGIAEPLNSNKTVTGRSSSGAVDSTASRFSGPLTDVCTTFNSMRNIAESAEEAKEGVSEISDHNDNS